MKKYKRPRRFIAGARCPACGARDTLYFPDETSGSFACIECRSIAPSKEAASQPIKLVNGKIKH